MARAPRLGRCQTSTSMRRFGHILSIALITAGVVVIADAGLTLADKEPLSSIYGSIKQGEAADQLKEIEAVYPSPGRPPGARAMVRDERRKIAILAGRFAAADRRPASRSGGSSPRRWTASTWSSSREPTRRSLQKGPGHYPETPFPGQGGTVGIAGHRTTYLAPFRHIDSMEKGDRIYLEMPYANSPTKCRRPRSSTPATSGSSGPSATNGSCSAPATRSTAPNTATSSSPR